MTTMADLGLLYSHTLVAGECGSGKLRYYPRANAEQALELTRLSGKSWRKERAVYPCLDCGGWHLTCRDWAGL